MKIISVIVIENNEVTNVTSFAVENEEDSAEVNEAVENRFSDEVLKLTEMTLDEFEGEHGDMSNHTENGRFELSNGTTIDSVNIAWSFIYKTKK